MPTAGGTGGPERTVKTLSGDCTVLSVVVVTPSKIVIVVNSRYPGALAHAERHLCAQPDTEILICAPECPGA